MARKEIPFDMLRVRPHHLWNSQWLLLTVGDFKARKFNAMTVGWGSLGTMWGRPFAQTVVRPTRYTYQFLKQCNTFTLCAFPSEYRQALQLLGTRSGRDGDKIAQAGLTPIASTQVAAPGFAEADLIIECRQLYWDDLEPSHFLDSKINGHYPKQDYHRVFFGEILAIWGTDTYRADS